LAAGAVRTFYLILRNYAPVSEVAAALRNPGTFEGPPGVMPVPTMGITGK